MKSRGLFLFVFALAASACAPPAVPNRPSWDQDVFPILQGSCNHCHGETVGKLMNQPLGRLDFCDPTPFVNNGITQATMWLGAKLTGGTFNGYLKSLGELPRMPPPPAAPLSDYEMSVLAKWGGDANADKCNKQRPNRDPVVQFIGEPEWTGNDLRLTVDVSDPDGDQVLGKVTVGAATAIIPASGRRQVEVLGAQRGMPITVMVMDGYGDPQTASP